MKRMLLLSMVFSFVFATSSWAQRTVSGKVTDESGEGLPGVNVVIKGTTTGVTSDLDGNYQISVPDDNTVLVFSSVSMSTQEVTVGVRSVIDLGMALDTKKLQEVIVVGYGTTLKTELTSAIASVSAEELGRLPTLSPDQALQGLASGVFVSSQGGAPGGAMNVRVRGQTSVNSGQQPLYVVDGIIISVGNLSQDAIGGADQNVLNTLNPQDIESMQVLKDAASTAIYGARAANGVVLITTKRGETGKVKIDLRMWTGTAKAIRVLQKLTGAEQIMIEREGHLNDNPAWSPDDVRITNEALRWDGVSNGDWVNAVFREAKVKEYQLSASGGSEQFKFYLSGSYRDEEGVMLGSEFQRFSSRVNLDYNATDDLTIGTSLSFASTVQDLIQNDNNIYGIYSAAILTANNFPIYDSETGEFLDGLPGFNTNAVRSALTSKQLLTTYKFSGNWNFTYKLPVEGLAIRTDFNYDWTMTREDIYTPKETGQGRSNQGTGEYNQLDQGIYTVEPTLRYSDTFGGYHKFTAISGMTFQGRRRTQGSVNGQGFARSSLQYLTSAAVVNAGNSFRVDQTFQSVFGRVNYAYDQKYLASVSVRKDGSSRFGPGNKFGTFWAVSAGWNFSEEDFFNVSFIDFGKVRASYGLTGNDQIGDFRYIGTFTGGANYLDLPALSPTALENPALQWEETTMFDVGLEVAFLKSRLNMNLGYFSQKTDLLLYQNQVPWTTGFGSFWDNIGAVENSGIELDLDGIILDMGDFQWTSKLNITFLQNEITELNTDEPLSAGFASAVIKGEPINTFYGLHWLGVDPATGNSVFEDVDKDGIVSGEDFQIIGDHSPDFIGGFTTRFTYKGLSLDAFFQFVNGVDVFNLTHQFSRNVSALWGLEKAVLRRWRQPGDITDIPRASQTTATDWTTDNDRFLSDGSYIRLKNVTLAYDIPSDIVSKAKFRSARVYIQGTNLLTWTRYNGQDPEVSAFGFTNTALGTDFLTFPQTRMYSIGVNLGL